jgi:hypothetical protein
MLYPGLNFEAVICYSSAVSGDINQKLFGTMSYNPDCQTKTIPIR